jgi:choice-of-anchor B domain-containing protein
MNLRWILGFLLCLWGSVWGQNALNLGLVGHLPNDTLTNGQYISTNDIWGYADHNGHEYALVGKFNGLSIVSLLNPAQPQQLYFSPGTGSIWRDIKTYGSYAYVCNDIGGGIKLIDLSGLPDQISVTDSVIPGINRAHNLWIEGNRLYIAGSPFFNGGIGVYSLQNPSSPTFLGEYTDRYVHDVYVRNERAYAAEIYQPGMSIVDFKNVANPVRIGEVAYAGAFTHNTWLNDAGTVCFTTDEQPATYIRSWDVSNPTNIQLLDQIRSSVNAGQGMPHNVHVLNDYLITSYYTDGIHLIDAARPHNLIEVGYYPTGGSVWGAYPYLPSGLILASDIQKGLFVLSPNLERAAYLEGLVVDSANGMGLQDVRVQILGTDLIDSTRTNGEFALGGLLNGTVQVNYVKYGYHPQSKAVDLSKGMVSTESISLAQADIISVLGYEIRDSLSGNLIEEAFVQIQEPFSGTTFQQKSEKGQVEFQKVASGNYELMVGAWGYQTQRWEVPITEKPKPDTLWLSPAYYDDFTFPYGWLSEGSTVAGGWERVKPIGGYEQDSLCSPEGDLSFDIGEEAFVTTNSAVNGTVTPVRNGFVQLASPPMDFRAYEDPWLYFHYWFTGLEFSTGAGLPTTDSLVVKLQNADTTLTIAQYSGYQPSWRVDSVRIADYQMQLDSAVKLIFVTANYELDEVVEAAVDQFWVGDKPASNPTTVEPQEVDKWLVYPNPVQAQLIVRQKDCANCPGHLRVFDALGRLVMTQDLDGRPLDFPYSRGMYWLEIRGTKGEVSTQKVLKR